VWVTARGWASLDQDEVLLPEHRFPASAITKLITATAVLRLVADGRVRLDDPANAYLRTIRLADDAVTVRELLSHTGGVDDLASMFADRIPTWSRSPDRSWGAAGGTARPPTATAGTRCSGS
jgi:CubicO group peptidase (beta-lactamase class C family)